METMDDTARVQEARAQLMALAAPAYTVTVRDGQTGRAFTVKNQTADQIVKKWQRWTEKNGQGDDIYITPESSACFYIVIDDVKVPDDIYAYGPCYIQETSAGNFQGVVRYMSPVVQHDVTWRAVTAACRELNRRHGDPKVSSPRQPFRLAGFMNRKPTRDNFLVTSLFCEPKQYASEIFEEIVWQARKKIEAADAKKVKIEGGTCEDFDAAARFFEREKKKMLGRCRVNCWPVDMSRVDFNVIKAMKKEGFSRDVVYEVFEKKSDVSSRHRDPAGYLSLTLSKIY